MSLLTCKLQYRDFEPGEFVEEKKVTLETAISIIKNFPWVEQREHFAVDLTSPSVTFQNNNENFLKLSLYYNNKFILYYFDGEHLYTKSFFDYESTFQTIDYFFRNLTIDLSLFKKENTWLKELRKHFISDDFVYTVNSKTVWSVMDKFTKLLIICDGFGLLYIIIASAKNGNYLIKFFTFFIIFFLCGGVNVLLSLTYYHYSKNKVLNLSKGSPSFLFGDINQEKVFNKSDIIQIVVKQNNANRCLWNNFTVTYIDFVDSSQIIIPSILLDGYSIHQKILSAPYKTDIVLIPFIK